jgi:phosphoribosyl 1,2-cyclic phosphodiesterase
MPAMIDSDLVVLGARGSATVGGRQFQRYGGSTTCLATEAAPGHYLVVDCGAGLRSLGPLLPRDEALEFTVLLTHYHWDHIEGLPTLAALEDRRNRFTFYGPRWQDSGVGEILEGVIRPPWFPTTMRERPAGVAYRDPVAPIRVGRLTVHTAPLRHPQGSIAYRLEAGDRSVVVATDHEAGDPQIDAGLAAMAAGTDVLIHDAQYTPEEYEARRRGWGHSTWHAAVEAARACGAGRLVLTSHDPGRTDDQVDDLVRLARAGFPLTAAAFPGMAVPL